MILSTSSYAKNKVIEVLVFIDDLKNTLVYLNNVFP